MNIYFHFTKFQTYFPFQLSQKYDANTSVLDSIVVAGFLDGVHHPSGLCVVVVVVVLVLVLVHQWSHPAVLVDCTVVHHGEVFVVENVVDSAAV